MAAGHDMKTYEPSSRASWRQWLEEHHGTEPGVWLVVHKKGSPSAALSYDEAVEEALCFGWVDSKTRTLDEHRFLQTFTPRRQGGTWSASNKERVERLIAAGLMRPAGYQAIEAAKLDGSWDALEAIDNLEVPDDLAFALAEEPDASRNFHAFSASAKKGALWWIATAKRAETRARRIAEVVRRSVRNERPVG